MNVFQQTLCVIGLQLFSVAVFAQAVHVKDLIYSSSSSKSRLRFNVSASPKHRVFVLDKPSRLVIDIANAVLDASPKQPVASHPLFAKIRAAAKNDKDLRIVVDLKMPVRAEHFSLASSNKNSRYLTIDLTNKVPLSQLTREIDVAEVPKAAVADSMQQLKAKAKPQLEKPAVSESIASESEQPATLTAVKTSLSPTKRFVVAIDAGHGGDDPGAHGVQGTEEKVITLAIAKKLAALISAQPGMKAVLIRKKDVYIDLRKRMELARQAKAELFISIHADAFKDTSVRGASVYTLSTRGASSEAAKWLAESENAVEVGGVSLNDKEDVLASVLLDLSQTATQQASDHLAACVLKKFQSISPMHKDSVQKAGFMVLKSPDIPSILVETAFISNPFEEQNLLSSSYQTKTAKAIFLGIVDYVNNNVPVESRVAALSEN